MWIIHNYCTTNQLFRSIRFSIRNFGFTSKRDSGRMSTAESSMNEQKQEGNYFTSKEHDDSPCHLESISHDLEAKPITEKMDHWYLDLKKNLMVKSIFLLLLISPSSIRLNSINYDCNFLKKPNKILYVRNKRKTMRSPLDNELHPLFLLI